MCGFQPKTGECPDQLEGLADFHDVFANKLDKPTHWVNIEQPVIITRSASVGQIRIKNGGKLIFKDHGPDAVKDGDGHIKLRAVNIKISAEGQLWIGSRNCRYQGYADISLYGDRDAHEPDEHTGYKYLWASGKSVLELHGKEKKSWTLLDGGHIYQENTPTDPIFFEQAAISEMANPLAPWSSGCLFNYYPSVHGRTCFVLNIHPSSSRTGEPSVAT